MPAIRFRLTSLLTALTLALVAACTPAATATVTPTATTTPATVTPLACTEEIIWPQLVEVRPAEIQPGGEATVIASGGYVRCGDAYNESARNFALTFDGQPAGTLGCYVNHCEAKLVVPAGATAGELVIAVEGGSAIILHVSNSQASSKVTD